MSQSALSYGSEKAFDFSLYLTKEESRGFPLNRSSSVASNTGSSSTDEYVNILHPNYAAVQMMKGSRDSLTLLEENNTDLSTSEVKVEEMLTTTRSNYRKNNDDGRSGLDDDSDGGTVLMDESLSPSETHIHYGRPDLRKIIAQLAADALYRRGSFV